MNKEMKKWVKQNFPQKAERIIKGSLSEKKIREAGIELYDHEVFTQIWRFGEYYGSNYGRLISTKFGRIKLRKENVDSTNHIGYVITNPSEWDGEVQIEAADHKSLSGNQLVGQLFLHNYWEGIRERQLETHHLDHNPLNNDWRNILLCPVWIHKLVEHVDIFRLCVDSQYVPMTPYEIMEKTGLSLEEIANPLKRDPDFTKNQGSKDIEGYHVGSHIIGFTLIDPGWREELQEKGRKLGQQTRKRKTK